MQIKRNVLFTPGPATTTDTVKKALLVPDICPREPEFGNLLEEIGKDLTRIVHGEGQCTCVLFAGSGTAAVEAAILSAVPPGKKIAVAINGAYGQRMIRISRAFGIPCLEIPFSWDEPVHPDRVDSALRKDGQAAVLAMVHHETTSGLLNPLDLVGEVAKSHGCTYLVDAISSFAGIPIRMDSSKADLLVSSSNKCIQGMAGLSFVICRNSALKQMGSHPPRSFYLDLVAQHDFMVKEHQMRYTPPVQIVYALKQAIAEYFQEGETQRHERYRNNWRTMRNGIAELGFDFLLDSAHESQLILTVLEPESKAFQFTPFHDALKKKGFTIYPGKIPEIKAFRVGTIGDIFPDDVRAFLVAVKEILLKMGV
jgi:2-aminoethylphosphonate-pyruvate transaminase